MSAVLIAGGLLSTLFKHPEQLDKLLEQIAIGYRMGAKTALCVAFAFFGIRIVAIALLCKHHAKSLSLIYLHL